MDLVEEEEAATAVAIMAATAAVIMADMEVAATAAVIMAVMEVAATAAVIMAVMEVAATEVVATAAVIMAVMEVAATGVTATAVVTMDLIARTRVNLLEQKAGKTEVMEILLITLNMKMAGAEEKGGCPMKVMLQTRQISNPFL